MGRVTFAAVNLGLAGVWVGLLLTLRFTVGWRPEPLLFVAPLLHMLAAALRERLQPRWKAREKFEITTPGLRELPLYPRPGLPRAERGMLD
jgi:hypothetical protein